jgi:hypothetical protein
MNTKIDELETMMPAEMPPGVAQGYLTYNEKRASLLASLKNDKQGKPAEVEAAIADLERDRARLMCEPTAPPVETDGVNVGKLFEGSNLDNAWRARVHDFAARFTAVLARYIKTMNDSQTFTGEAQTVSENRAQSAKRKALAPLVREYAVLEAEHARRFGVAKEGNKVTK